MNSTTKYMLIALALISLCSFQTVDGGMAPATGCYALCYAAMVSCYSAAGFGITATFGMAAAGAPAAVIACNATFASCMAGCSAFLALPTP